MAKFLLPKLTDLLKQRKIEMTTIYDRIKEDMKDAMRNKDQQKVNSLRYVIGVFDTKARLDKPELATDDNVIAFLTGFVRDLKKSIDDCDNAPGDFSLTRANLVKEIETYNVYLPQQLTTEEIDAICAEQNFPSIKEAMAFFKTNYFKQYDAKYVSAKYK